MGDLVVALALSPFCRILYYVPVDRFVALCIRYKLGGAFLAEFRLEQTA